MASKQRQCLPSVNSLLCNKQKELGVHLTTRNISGKFMGAEQNEQNEMRNVLHIPMESVSTNYMYF